MEDLLEKDPHAVLGLSPDAGQDEIKRAYRERARAEHPDMHPPGQRHRQHLRMMEVNQAYMRLVATGEPERVDATPGTPPSGRRTAPTFAGIPAERRSGGRDPAYDIYRQGYVYLGRARALMNPRKNLDEEELRRMKFHTALEALRLMERAYRCFLNVVTGYPESMWIGDALEQLEGIERMNRVYQRMCENSVRDGR